MGAFFVEDAKCEKDRQQGCDHESYQHIRVNFAEVSRAAVSISGLIKHGHAPCHRPEVSYNRPTALGFQTSCELARPANNALQAEQV